MKFCPECGYQNNDSAKFCTNCGKTMMPQAAEAEQKVAAPVVPEKNEAQIPQPSQPEQPSQTSYQAPQPGQQPSFYVPQPTYKPPQQTIRQLSQTSSLHRLLAQQPQQ